LPTNSREAVIRIGTRGSLLATTQAGIIKAAIEAKGRQAELVLIATAGDKSSDPVAEIGVGWRVWLGFFVAVIVIFLYVWLF